MNAGEVIAEQNGLRLARDHEHGRHATLCYHGEPLIKLELIPSWFGEAPIAAARMVLNSLRPQPPRFIPDASSRQFVGGIYSPLDDAIVLYRSAQQHELSRALTIIHESVHATGHPTRCHRSHYPEILRDPCPLLDHEDYDSTRTDYDGGEAEIREETVAWLGTALIAPRLGLGVYGSTHFEYWFPRASTLSLENLTGAIADARKAYDFIFNRPPS